MKLRKLLLLGLAGAALLSIVVLATVLSQASVELTEHTVHKRLLVPIGPYGVAGFHLYGGTGDDPVIPGFLNGPVVRVSAAGTWSATWFCENHAQRKQGSDTELVIDCAGKRYAYPLAKAAIPPAVFPMPGKLAVLSDIEGNSTFLDAQTRCRRS
jgi:hypothetical protein